MNTIIYQTLRAGAILAASFLLFADSAFAAPSLSPVSALQITDTGAMLLGHVANPSAISNVWFEYGTDSALARPLIVGMSAIYHEGYFRVNITDLIGGTTYYYRSLSKEGAITVSSPVASFKTTGGAVQALATSATASSVANTAIQESDVAKKVTPVATQNTGATTRTANATSIKSTTASRDTAVPVAGYTNTASVVGAWGSGVFPTTLIEWLVLFVVLLAVILAGRILFEYSEQRKRKPISDEDEDETDLPQGKIVLQ